MNKQQKEVAAAQLADEKKVLDALKKHYKQAAKDAAEKISFHQDKIDKIEILLKDLDGADDDVRSLLQSQIYQKQYQEALKKQIDGIVDNMNQKQYKTVDAYLKGCYEKGFLGTMYDLHGQGMPFIMPIDQKAMVKAATLDSKISEKLYKTYTAELKKRIQAEVSRGIATNQQYATIARNLNMQTNIGLNKAMRIARTEGHGVQIQAAVDAQYQAKKAGANILKQWNSVLDGKTRTSHRLLDGELRELDETFSNGMKYPSDPAGGAAEVVNCRCLLMQRARKALDEDEYKRLQERARYFGLLAEDSKEFGHEKGKLVFSDFQKKYMKALENFGGSGTIGDISNRYGFNVITGSHSIEADAIAVNPNFSKGKEFQNNCGYCSIAYELRRRGYDVEANPKMGLFVSEWQSMFAGFNPVPVDAKRKESAIKEMKHKISQWGDGARGSVFVVWDGRSYGHFFSIEVENGEVRFVDPQNGNADVEDYFKRVKPSSILYGRVDNLDLTDNVKVASKNK